MNRIKWVATITTREDLSGELDMDIKGDILPRLSEIRKVFENILNDYHKIKVGPLDKSEEPS